MLTAESLLTEAKQIARTSIDKDGRVVPVIVICFVNARAVVEAPNVGCVDMTDTEQKDMWLAASRAVADTPPPGATGPVCGVMMLTEAWVAKGGSGDVAVRDRADRMQAVWVVVQDSSGNERAAYAYITREGVFGLGEWVDEDRGSQLSGRFHDILGLKRTVN